MKNGAASRRVGSPKKKHISWSKKVRLHFLVGRIVKENKKRIIPRHVLLAVRSDEELHKLLAGVTIAHGRNSIFHFSTFFARVAILNIQRRYLYDVFPSAVMVNH
ncbi:hypothetical protein M9H77_29771 [Catharanthus roseus]|uniref:Uncharacterized protein n=1 Tax=Catharanthus roseus TaxID=4058 RepID=A0ACB9ZVQ3_CATRO|nr:hypothetical protein M9H77_29771 [Catharanthus roseus]